MREPGGKACSVCPPENLCPNGPRPEHKFTYDKLIEIIEFPEIPQKMMMSFQLGNSGILKKDTTINISMIIPSVTGAQNIQRHMKEVLIGMQVYVDSDYLVLGSIQYHLGEDPYFTLARFISHNPGKSFFGFGGGGDTQIQNSSLLVISQNELLILKLNWNKWFFVNEPEKID